MQSQLDKFSSPPPLIFSALCSKKVHACAVLLVIKLLQLNTTCSQRYVECGAVLWLDFLLLVPAIGTLLQMTFKMIFYDILHSFVATEAIQNLSKCIKTSFSI